jgi:general secretion pathway protein E/type IV pilus assembly protein PilB
LVKSEQISTEIINILSPEQAWEYNIVPFNSDASEHYFFTSSEDQDIKDELEILFGKTVIFQLITEDEIKVLLNRYYRKTTTNQQALNADASKDFLDKLIEEAKNLDSSDIHIEAFEDKSRVRFRIDGKLIERYIIKKEDYPAFINKIKIQAQLDIAEKRLPQDGRILFRKFGSKFDIRVSVLPTLHGEKIVLRILNNDATDVDIEALGFQKETLERYMEGVRKPNGIVLISGPTGSGKTTTLYATLKLLNNKDTNIVTIEDPIEYTLEGINQVQLKEEIGLSFARALRTFLRQDPDVIMLGEIRDGETANMAIRASLTGHLVLSTIHTNSAWGTITRLIDMGVPPFLLASTLNLSVAQRLVRKLCPHCKKKEPFDKNLYPRNYKPSQEISEHYTATGCDECFHTGYKGRIAVYEVIPFDSDLGELVKNGIFDARNHLKEKGVTPLSESAFELLKTGKSSIEEVYPLLTND